MHIERVTLGEKGRLVIPAAMRKEVGFKPGDTVVLESDGDSVLVRTLDQVVREVQAAFADVAPVGALLSDELIAERRTEGERDSQN